MSRQFKHVPREPASCWWCHHHWAPYVAKGDENLGQRACDGLTLALTRLPDFTVEYNRVMREFSPHGERTQNWLATKTVEELFRRTGKPMCCLVGDAEMDRIQRGTTA